MEGLRRGSMLGIERIIILESRRTESMYWGIGLCTSTDH